MRYYSFRLCLTLFDFSIFLKIFCTGLSGGATTLTPVYLKRHYFDLFQNFMVFLRPLQQKLKQLSFEKIPNQTVLCKHHLSCLVLVKKFNLQQFSLVATLLIECSIWSQYSVTLRNSNHLKKSRQQNKKIQTIMLVIFWNVS